MHGRRAHGVGDPVWSGEDRHRVAVLAGLGHLHGQVVPQAALEELLELSPVQRLSTRIDSLRPVLGDGRVELVKFGCVE